MGTKSSIVIDGRGNEIPRSLVDPVILARNDTVEMIVKSALALEARMVKEKEKIMERIWKYEIKKRARLAVDESTKKGNMTLTNINGDKQVEVSLHDVITLNDMRNEAETVFDECITALASDARQELVAIFRQAFNLDKKGRVDMSALRRLKALQIKHPLWKTFQDLISRAEEVESTRQYLNIRTREENGKWKTVNLNFSSI